MAKQVSGGHGKTPKIKEGPRRVKPRGRPASRPESLAIEHAGVRNQICAAAMALFSEGGAEAVVMRNIAKQLGVSAMMPYRYFASKDHLLMELRTRAFDQLTAQLNQARAEAKSPTLGLRAVCRAWLDYAANEPHAYRLMFDLWAFDNPSTIKADFGDAARRHWGSWWAVNGAVTEYLKAMKVRKDFVTASHVTWSTLHGLASLHLARKLVFERALEEMSRPLVDAILAGLLAKN